MRLFVVLVTLAAVAFATPTRVGEKREVSFYTSICEIYYILTHYR
jgi:hypothetical protein